MNNFKETSKLLYYLYILIGNHIPKEKINKVVDDETKCLTEEEKNIKRFSNSFNYLFNNVNQTFDNELINNSYYLLSNKQLSSEIVNKIISLYYENFDNSVYTLNSIIHLFIANNIEEKNIEFAFLISNYIMKKKDKGFLIPYEYSHIQYKRAIKGGNLSDLIRVLFDIEQIEIGKKPCKLTRQEIIDRIKEVKDELISKYEVKKLYLFGSFAKGTNKETSDVDFIAILKDNLINVERLDRIDEIKEYLNGILDCDVDILDFTYALKNLGENEMENVITLI